MCVIFLIFTIFGDTEQEKICTLGFNAMNELSGIKFMISKVSGIPGRYF